MPILAIDTSAGTSVAITHGGKLLAEYNSEDNMKHAERIGSGIAGVLKDAGLRPQQIKTVVVGRGPAPFTGLRVGIAAAIAFAEGVGAPLFGVCSLDAIALAAEHTDASSPLLVTSDARRSEVYWATYEGQSKNRRPLRTRGPAVIKPAALEELLAAEGIRPIRATGSISAAALARVFELQQLDGVAERDVSALYLRAPDAAEPKPVQR